MLLLLFQCKQNTSTPTYILFHCFSCSSLYTHPSFTATGLKLELINRFFFCNPLRNMSQQVPLQWSGLQTTTYPVRPLSDSLLLTGLFLIGILCPLLSKSFFFCNEVNKPWCIDLLMVWSLLVCLIVFQIKLSFYKACTGFLETFNLAVFWPREKTLSSALTIWL